MNINIYIHIYIYDNSFVSGIRSGLFFRLGLSMRFAELIIHGC